MEQRQTSQPLRVGFIITPLSNEASAASLAQCILEQNTRQSSVQFELLGSTEIIERDFRPGTRLEMSEVQKCVPQKLSSYRASEGFPPDFPIAILASTSFTNNYYVVGDNTWAVIALDHWVQKDGYEFANLLFLSRLVRAAVTFAGVVGLVAHSSTISCIFDKTVQIDQAEFSVKSGFLCADCAAVISGRAGKSFTEDIRFLLAEIAEKSRLLTAAEQPDPPEEREQDEDTETRPIFARFLKLVLDYLLATTFKRVLTTIMGFGVVLLSGLNWQDVAAIFIQNTIGESDDAGNAFGQFVGFGMIIVSIAGHTWLHLADKRSKERVREEERTKGYAELIGELKVLIRAYEDTTTTRPGGYYSETTRHCRNIARRVSELASVEMRMNPTLRKITNPQIDASGEQPLFDTSVEELREFTKTLEKAL